MPRPNYFSMVRAGREGAQLQRALTAFSFVFVGWHVYSDVADPFERDWMPAIPFDKFAMALFRVWNEAYQRTGFNLMRKDASEITADEESRCVTFPSPWQPVPGKHGRGLARRKRDLSNQYFLELLHAPTRSGAELFSRRPASGSADEPHASQDTGASSNRGHGSGARIGKFYVA